MSKKTFVIYNHPEEFVLKEDGSLYTYKADSIEEADDMLWTLEDKLVEDSRIEERSVLVVVEVNENSLTIESATEELHKLEGLDESTD